MPVEARSTKTNRPLIDVSSLPPRVMRCRGAVRKAEFTAEFTCSRWNATRALWRACPGGTRRTSRLHERGGCSCAGWGATLYCETAASRMLHPNRVRHLAWVLRVTTRAAGSDCLTCHGRGPVPLSCMRSAASKLSVMRFPQTFRDVRFRDQYSSLGPG
jgi:hypothetical protein